MLHKIDFHFLEILSSNGWVMEIVARDMLYVFYLKFHTETFSINVLWMLRQTLLALL